MINKILSSVWLTFDEKDENHLRDIINNLAGKYGSRLNEKLKNIKDYQFNPHVSLIYKKEMTEKSKIEEVKNLEIKESFTINRIEIWDMNIPNWKKLFTKNL